MLRQAHRHVATPPIFGGQTAVRAKSTRQSSRAVISARQLWDRVWTTERFVPEEQPNRAGNLNQTVIKATFAWIGGRSNQLNVELWPLSFDP